MRDGPAPRAPLSGQQGLSGEPETALQGAVQAGGTPGPGLWVGKAPE